MCAVNNALIYKPLIATNFNYFFADAVCENASYPLISLAVNFNLKLLHFHLKYI